MATNAKIETGDPALAIALCWFAVFYSAFMVGYWLWVEYFGIQRKLIITISKISELLPDYTVQTPVILGDERFFGIR